MLIRVLQQLLLVWSLQCVFAQEKVIQLVNARLGRVARYGSCVAASFFFSLCFVLIINAAIV